MTSHPTTANATMMWSLFCAHGKHQEFKQH